jgi:hypothetical protein
VDEIYPLDPSGGRGGAVKKLSVLDRLGIWIEETMTSSFTNLGTTCAQYPIPVIVLSIGFAAGLCTGIQWLEVS